MSLETNRIVNRWSITALAVAVLSLLNASFAEAQTARTLYTWGGTANLRGWGAAFGDQTGVTYDNNLSGILRVTETGHGGTSYALSDDANRLDDQNVGSGGLDLFGLDAIEIDLAMFNFSGTPVNIAPYVQASPNFDFINILDVAVPADNSVNTYTIPLSLLNDAQKAHIRFIGVEVREHAAAGDSFWQISEIRSVGAGAPHRVIATHEDGTIESGFNGGRINYDQGAVAGNDGGSNQTGLSVGGGVLGWTDLGQEGDPNQVSGVALSYQNGQWPWAGNDFESRPHDNTNYNFVTFRMRATDVPGDAGADTSIGLQGFSQVENSYTYNVLGFDNLPVDGQFYDVVFPLGAFKSAYANNISVDFFPHEFDTVIEIDSVIYTIPEPSTMALCGLVCALFAGGRKRRTL